MDERVSKKKVLLGAVFIFSAKVLASVLIGWAVATAIALPFWSIFVFMMGAIMLWNVKQIVEILIEEFLR